MRVRSPASPRNFRAPGPVGTGMGLLRNGLLTIAALLLAGAAATPPALADGFEPVTVKAVGTPLGDGGRWVAYAATARKLRVIDEATGTVRDHAIPCVIGVQSNPLLAVGGGQAVVGCRRLGRLVSRPLLLDLRSGSWHTVPGIDELLASFDGQQVTHGLEIDAVGERWIAGRVYGQPELPQVAIDWRSGALGPGPTAATVRDLDAAALEVPLCAPLARRPEVSWGVDLPSFEPLQFEPPFALTNGWTTALTLQRCGSATATTIFPRRYDEYHAFGAQLSNGIVSWEPAGGRGSICRPARCGWRGGSRRTGCTRRDRSTAPSRETTSGRSSGPRCRPARAPRVRPPPASPTTSAPSRRRSSRAGGRRSPARPRS